MRGRSWLLASSFLFSLASFACSDSGASTDSTSAPVAGSAGSAGSDAQAGKGGSNQAGQGGKSGGSGGTAAGSGGTAGSAGGDAGSGGTAAGAGGEAGAGGSEAGSGGSDAGSGGSDAGAGGSDAGAGGSDAGSGGSGQAGAGGAGAGGSGQSGSAGSGGGCVRSPGPDDHGRKVVVSHPFLGPGEKGKAYEVFDLSLTGQLSKTDKTFTMGTATNGEIVFTPDGQLGFVPQEDGTIGVFSLKDGEPVVINAAFDPGTYVSSLVMSPAGDRLYVLNTQWRNNGGGIYSVAIGCEDDSLTPEGLVAAGKLPAAMQFLPGDPSRALVTAVDLLDSAPGNSAYILSLGSPAAQVAQANAFGDDKASVSSMVVTHDGQFGLIADNSEFSGLPNRIAVVAISPDSVKSVQVLSPLSDPFSMIASPFDNNIVATNGYGNALVALAFDPDNKAAPFSVGPTPVYQGKKPQLPADMVMIRRGQLTGHILLSEIEGLRQMKFPAEGGPVVDLGLFNFGGGGDDVTKIPGAVGVQP